VDKRTGIRWIGTKSRPKSMSTLVSRFSWKPKINHYEKYSDIIRTSKYFILYSKQNIFFIYSLDPKRTVPVKSIDTIRQKLTQPWASWRIDQLTTYLSDLTQDEQMTLNQLSDITQLLDINDQSIRTTIEDLIEVRNFRFSGKHFLFFFVKANIQRHRCFTDQLTQISSVLVNLLDHGNTLRDISKSSITKRTKER